MAMITTFDTHKYVRRLEAAGVPLNQAEIQAEVLTEAFNVNLESLVTKDYQTARFVEQKAYIDTRFAEQRVYIDTRFAEQKAYIDSLFAEMKAYIDIRIAEQDMRWEKRFVQLEAKVDSNHRVFIWTQAIIMAAVILPYMERLMAL